jgi:hypothetical protein
MAASALVILALTLFPTGSAGGLDAVGLADRMATLRGLADTIVNILLFMPPAPLIPQSALASEPPPRKRARTASP